MYDAYLELLASRPIPLITAKDNTWRSMITSIVIHNPDQKYQNFELSRICWRELNKYLSSLTPVHHVKLP